MHSILVTLSNDSVYNHSRPNSKRALD
jgi:hypothetical protein